MDRPCAKLRLFEALHQLQPECRFYFAGSSEMFGRVREVHSWQSGAMGWLLAEKRPPGGDPFGGRTATTMRIGAQT